MIRKVIFGAAMAALFSFSASLSANTGVSSWSADGFLNSQSSQASALKGAFDVSWWNWNWGWNSDKQWYNNKKKWKKKKRWWYKKKKGEKPRDGYSVPEINAASTMPAAMLLIGLIALMRERRKRQLQ